MLEYKFSLLFINTYNNNNINRFLDEISKTLRINLKEKNSEKVLEKLIQVLAYFNFIFLRFLIVNR